MESGVTMPIEEYHDLIWDGFLSWSIREVLDEVANCTINCTQGSDLLDEMKMLWRQSYQAAFARE